MMKRNRRVRWAFILVLALVMGCLPVDPMWIKAEEASALAEGISDSAEGSSVSEEGIAALADTQPDHGLQNPRTDENGVTTWDCVWFGNYWQEDTNGDNKADQTDDKTPIKWRVLSVEGDDAFLLADQSLDCRQYNTTLTNVTWETCTIRSWLNGYDADTNICREDYSDNNFLDNAFNASEQAAIQNTTVVNEKNPQYGTSGGIDTTDKVYLLSISEAKKPSYGFTSLVDNTKTRGAKNTAYAKEQGANTSTSTGYAGNGAWWLRSPGLDSNFASDVWNYGYVAQSGSDVDYDFVAVRPALHLNLASVSVWSKAGTVSSTGDVDEIPPAATASPTATPASSADTQPDHGLQNPRTDENGVTTWDCVWFGNYWQEDTNGDNKADQTDDKTPVRWRVLSVEGDDAFLLADQSLDCRQYNTTQTNVTWETCTIRSWLNGYGADTNICGEDYSDNNFLDNAFNASEQAAIQNTTVVNEKNPQYSTSGGIDTTDKVYFLSISEALNPSYGFISSVNNTKTRGAKNTAYAKEQGANTSTSTGYVGNGSWWLRSPGNRRYDASLVPTGGYVSQYGSHVNNAYVAARPALHLNLASVSVWSKAGTVSLTGYVDETPPASTASPTATPASSADTQPGHGLQNPRTDENGVTTWDCVWFGNYWQEDTNGDNKADQTDEKTPIKWRVLSVEGDDVFLLADKSLDCQKYNTRSVDVTWETCTIRSWLNGYGAGQNQEAVDYRTDNFIKNAFTSVEQAAIKDTTVVNEKNPQYGTSGGIDTTDKVYLLSISEALNPSYGFISSIYNTKTREAKNTAYVRIQGADTSAITGTGLWWLRSPGDISIYASFVRYIGDVNQVGNGVDGRNVAARPALHLNLASVSVWSKAGTVSSTGEISEIPPASTASPSPTPTAAVTPTPATTASPTISPVSSGTPTETPTIPPILTASPSPTPSVTVTPTPAATALPTISPVSSGTPTETPTIPPASTASPSATATPSVTVTPTPVSTKTPSPDKDLSVIVDGLGVSEETAAKIQAAAKELNVSQDTILVTEQMIQSQKTDDDIKGSYFARIQARASQITQKNIKLSWNRVKGADGYEIYGNRCNTKKWIYEYKKMKTIENGNKKSFIDRNCKKGTYYKYIVRAYKIIDGKKVTIAASKTIHVTTTGGKNGNAKSVKVNKKKVSLKAGKKLKLRAKEIEKDKPLRHHREVSYESSVPDVAKVSKTGRIKAKKKGKCTVFAYAQSGVFRKIKVTVK